MLKLISLKCWSTSNFLWLENTNVCDRANFFELLGPFFWFRGTQTTEREIETWIAAIKLFFIGEVTVSHKRGQERIWIPQNAS